MKTEKKTLTAKEVIEKVASTKAMVTCRKDLIPEIIQIMNKEYAEGDFSFFMFGETAHITRTRKFVKHTHTHEKSNRN